MTSFPDMPAATAAVDLAEEEGDAYVPPNVRLVADDMQRVGRRELVPLNADVPTVVGVVRTALRRAAPLLGDLPRLPDLDVAQVSRLGAYVEALLYWHAHARRDSPSGADRRALVARGLTVRARMLQDLRAMIGHGVLAPDVLAPFRRSRSHRSKALDLMGLANLVRASWPLIAGRSLLTVQSANEAYQLGSDLLDACGERDSVEVHEAEATLQRDRAFTLVVRAYADLRAAVSFLRRHHGDADAIAPSLYVNRHRPPPARPASSGDPPESRAGPDAAPPSSRLPID